ncbi:MAG: hypothetical protein QM758_04520 [Armatimonas sp.]
MTDKIDIVFKEINGYEYMRRTTIGELYGFNKSPITNFQQLGGYESQLCGVLSGFALTVAVMLLERRGSNNRRVRPQDAYLYQGSVAIFILACGMNILAATIGLILVSDRPDSPRSFLLHSELSFNFGIGITLLFLGLYLCLLGGRQQIEYRSANSIFIVSLVTSAFFVIYYLYGSLIYYGSPHNAHIMRDYSLIPITCCIYAVYRFFLILRIHKSRQQIITKRIKDIDSNREYKNLHDISKKKFNDPKFPIEIKDLDFEHPKLIFTLLHICFSILGIIICFLLLHAFSIHAINTTLNTINVFNIKYFTINCIYYVFHTILITNSVLFTYYCKTVRFSSSIAIRILSLELIFV